MQLHETIMTTSLQHTTHGIATSTEERALKLLGQGISPEATAAACGVSVSRISQLLSDDAFSGQVAALRYEALQKHNAQDNEYDALEDALTRKFKDSIPLMLRPMEILKGLQVINAMKRRGTSAPEAILEKQQVVNISLPQVVINNFTNLSVETNIHNQVVKVGTRDLTTMQSGTLLNAHKELAALPEKVSSNGYTKPANKPKRDPTDI